MILFHPYFRCAKISFFIFSYYKALLFPQTVQKSAPIPKAAPHFVQYSLLLKKLQAKMPKQEDLYV